MKQNRVAHLLREGRIPIGHMVVEFWTRGIAKLAEAAGFDFVIFDMEHSGASEADLADQLAWMKATPLAAFVRPAATDYQFISRALDAGAAGVMVPRVVDAEEVQRVVATVKYPPLGRRGISFSIAHDDYLAGDEGEKMRNANAETMIIVQIETETALDQIDEIMAIEGVDIAWPGQYDLSAALGILGEFEHPKLIDAIEKVLEASRRSGKIAGIQPTSVAQGAAWITQGFKCISFSEDMLVYRNACADAVGMLRSHIAASTDASGDTEMIE